MTHVSPTRILHHCERCGKGFYPKRYCHTRFCGQTCGKAHTGRQAKARAAATAQDRERAKAEAKAKRQAERAAQRQADAQRRKVEKVKRDALAKAEHYKPRPCQQCGKATPKELRGLNVMDSPELDHVTCLRAGGSHTRGNTQCLCRACNVAKSLDDAEQVMSCEVV